MPNDFNVKDFWASVSTEFKHCKTLIQILLCQLEEKIVDAKMTTYLGHLWNGLQQSGNEIPEGKEIMQNKEFSKIIKSFDVFITSKENTALISNLFGYPANHNEHKLAFMYAHALVNLFLSRLSNLCSKMGMSAYCPSFLMYQGQRYAT